MNSDIADTQVCPVYREGGLGRLQDLPKLFSHTSDDNCVFFPYTNQFSNSPDTNRVPSTLVLTVDLELAWNPQVKGSVPQNCPHYGHQHKSQVAAVLLTNQL